MIDFIADRGLKPYIDAVFALSDIRLAFDRLKSAAQFGKIELAIGEASSARGTG